jgi:hypothetical protein
MLCIETALQLPAQSHRVDSFKAHLPQPSVLGPYAYIENCNQRESTKTSRNQDQALTDMLRTLFNTSKDELVFSTYIKEVTDDASIKKYEFAPEYAELLARAMDSITCLLNDYWKAAGFTKVFSFR